MLRSLKRLIKTGFGGLGFEIRRARDEETEEATLARLIRLVGPSVVLDVGSNIGQFASVLRAVGYGGKIVSFEAMASIHSKLREVASKDSSWSVAPCAALGSCAGKLAINVSSNSVSSSLLPMHSAHLSAAPESAYISTQLVRVERLDELAIPFVTSTDRLLLKIDTQGYEMEVLRGSTKIISQVDAMQLELSLIPLYEGAPGFIEMVGYAEELGFEMFGLIPAFKDARSGRLLQVDGFFIRKP